MSDVECIPLRDLPPSAKLVYKTLEYTEAPLTQKQLAERSRLSARTVRYALERLERIGAVESEMNLADARQRFYTLAPDTVRSNRNE